MGYTTPSETNLSTNAAFDVILMDDNMPNLSGPEATAAIRAAGYGGLIFGVTGNSFTDQMENFKSKGADLVFTKPLNMTELYEAIKIKLKLPMP
jgi:CheY-like chemotaxis protein